MDEAQLYVILQGAVERSKGAATWTDVRLALMRAKEHKVREALNSLFSEMDFETLVRAEKLADAEVFRVKPAQTSTAQFVAYATPQPAAIVATIKPPAKRKGK